MTKNKSLTRNQKSVLGIFVARAVGKGIIAGYYHSSLVLIDLCRQLNTKQTYREQLTEDKRGKF